jgi:hypothetical protein
MAIAEAPCVWRRAAASKPARSRNGYALSKQTNDDQTDTGRAGRRTRTAGERTTVAS